MHILQINTTAQLSRFIIYSKQSRDKHINTLNCIINICTSIESFLVDLIMNSTAGWVTHRAVFRLSVPTGTVDVPSLCLYAVYMATKETQTQFRICGQHTYRILALFLLHSHSHRTHNVLWQMIKMLP